MTGALNQPRRLFTAGQASERCTVQRNKKIHLETALVLVVNMLIYLLGVCKDGYISVYHSSSIIIAP